MRYSPRAQRPSRADDVDSNGAVVLIPASDSVWRGGERVAPGERPGHYVVEAVQVSDGVTRIGHDRELDRRGLPSAFQVQTLVDAAEPRLTVARRPGPVGITAGTGTAVVLTDLADRSAASCRLRPRRRSEARGTTRSRRSAADLRDSGPWAGATAHQRAP